MIDVKASRHRFPMLIIQHAIWLYHRFPLSYRDVQELLHQRGIEVSLPPVAEAPACGRTFSTRMRPSQKAALDAFVMDLKRAGWPVSQEAVLEELLRLLAEDAEVSRTVTQRLTRV